jgi:hypothetical protein
MQRIFYPIGQNCPICHVNQYVADGVIFANYAKEKKVMVEKVSENWDKHPLTFYAVLDERVSDEQG